MASSDRQYDGNATLHVQGETNDDHVDKFSSSHLQDLKKCDINALCAKLAEFGISKSACENLRDKKCNGLAFFTLRSQELKKILPDYEKERVKLLEIISSTKLEKSKLKTLEKCDVDSLYKHLEERGISKDVCKKLRDKNCDGNAFFALTPQKLEKILPNYEKDRKKLLRIISFKELDKSKIFVDPVHGEYKMHPLLISIINRTEFQRLRDIKQLGGAYKVFCGASHNRFEHSLGVCHLAGRFGRILQQNQPEYISDNDILCLEVAGLCHDVGQGPFSRLFDQYVIPHLRFGMDNLTAGGKIVKPPTECSDKPTNEGLGEDEPAIASSGRLGYHAETLTILPTTSPEPVNGNTHVGGTKDETPVVLPTQQGPVNVKNLNEPTGNEEEFVGPQRKDEEYHWVRRVSARIFQYFAKHLEDDFELFGLNQRHVDFIAKLIDPPKREDEQKVALKAYRGKDEEFPALFFFQIVSNRKNQMDVDKFDYITRDAFQTGLRTGFNYQRLLMHTRIIKENGNLTIGFRDKIAPNVYDMYQARYHLYRSVYMHLPTMVVQLMIADAIKLASHCKIFSTPRRDAETSQPVWSIAETIEQIKDAIEGGQETSEDDKKAKELAFQRYLQLTDSVYFMIMYTPTEQLDPARKLLERVERRALYRLVGKTIPVAPINFLKETPPDECLGAKEKRCKEDILAKLSFSEEESEREKEDVKKKLKEQLLVKIVSIGYGVTGEHPLYGVSYYSKYDLHDDQARPLEPPADFEKRKEIHIRVFFTGEDCEILFDKAQKAFEVYCKSHAKLEYVLPEAKISSSCLSAR